MVFSKPTISVGPNEPSLDQKNNHPESRRFGSAPPEDRSVCTPTVVSVSNGPLDLPVTALNFHFGRVISVRAAPRNVRAGLSTPLHFASLRSAPSTAQPGHSAPLCSLRSPSLRSSSKQRFQTKWTVSDQNSSFRPNRPVIRLRCAKTPGFLKKVVAKPE